MKRAAARVIGGFEGTELTAELKELLDLGIGGIILFSRNLEGPEQCAELIAELRAFAGRPLMFCVDQEGGRVARLREPLTVWPDAAAYGRSMDTERIEAAGLALCSELRALGFNMNFAPVLDVNSHPDNPVIGPRAFGDRPDIVKQAARAWLTGARKAPMGTCGKHFPGHGHTDEDSHHALPVCPLPVDELVHEHVDPFADLSPLLDSIMTAHVVYPALDPSNPATLSRAALTGLARERLGFDGLIITDDLEMGALADAGEPRMVCERALDAGNDILLVCRDPAFVEAAAAACRDRVGTEDGARTTERSLARREGFLARCPDVGPLPAEQRKAALDRPDHRALADWFSSHSDDRAFDSPVASL